MSFKETHYSIEIKELCYDDSKNYIPYLRLTYWKYTGKYYYGVFCYDIKLEHDELFGFLDQVKQNIHIPIVAKCESKNYSKLSVTIKLPHSDLDKYITMAKERGGNPLYDF